LTYESHKKLSEVILNKIQLTINWIFYKM
jgi:hypothetical protein